MNAPTRNDRPHARAAIALPHAPAAASCVALALALALPAHAAKDTFTATIVDHPYGEDFFNGLAINNLGQVVGYVPLPDDDWWFTGPNGHHWVMPRSADYVWPDWIFGIDEGGRVVGTYRPGGYNTPQHAFVAGADGLIVDANPADASSSSGWGIDERGRITGQADFASGNQAFASGIHHRHDHALGTLGGPTSLGRAFSNGVLVGTSDTVDGQSHAFRMHIGDAAMTDLGTLGGANSTASFVNVRGQVVGWSDDRFGATQAFITEPGGTTMLEIADRGPNHGLGAGSQAYGINANGNVVGAAWVPHASKGFVTSRDGRSMHNLNHFVTLPNGSFVSAAKAINDRGQIVAEDWLDEGPLWLLTPTRDTWEQELEGDDDAP